MVTAGDVGELLRSQQADATLVVVAGRTKVVPGADLRSGQYPGGLLVISRQELATVASDIGSDGNIENMSQADLEAVAARLTTAVEQLGG